MTTNNAALLLIALKAQDDASKALRAAVKPIVDVKKQAAAADAPLARMSGTMGTVLKAGAIAATGALTALVGAGVKALMSASDVAESQNKVNVVFGESAAAINEFASTSAKSLGISRGAALDASGTFGNMFTQLGIAPQATADMSQGMIRLAADLGSFHNADITEVIAAQTAAFRGEFDSVQRFVPTINAAAVAEAAMAMTGKTATAMLTEQDKALATNKLLMEGAGKALGDFGNTSTGTANSMKIIKATVEDAFVTLGAKLLPIIEPLISQLASTLPAVIDTVIARFSAIGKVVGGLKAIFAEGDFTAGFADGMRELFGLEIHEDSKLVEGLFLVRDTIIFLKDIVLPNMSQAFSDATVFVRDHKDAQVALAGAVGFVAGPLALGAVTTSVISASVAMKAMLPVLAAMGASFIAFTGIGLIFAAIGIAIWALATDFGGVATTLSQIQQLIIMYFNKMRSDIEADIASVGQAFAAFGNTIGVIVQSIGAAFDWLGKGVHNNFVVPMRSAITSVWTWLQGFGEDVKGLFTGLIDSVGRVVPQFLSIGRDIVQGLWNGISGAWTGMLARLDGLYQSLPQGLRDFIEGNSPSKVFMRIGADIIAGLEMGIISNKGAVQNALLAMADIDALNADIDAMVRRGDHTSAIERMMFGGSSAEQAIAQVQQVHQVIRNEIAATAKAAEDAAKKAVEDAEKAAAATLKAQVDYYQKFVKPYADEARATNMQIAMSQWNQKLAANAAMFTRDAIDPLAPFDRARALQQQASMMRTETRGGRSGPRGSGVNQGQLNYLGGVASVLGINGTVRPNNEGVYTKRIAEELRTANETQLVMIELLQAIKDGALTVNDVSRKISSIQQKRSRMIADFGGGGKG